jgi:hypothetical protein
MGRELTGKLFYETKQFKIYEVKKSYDCTLAVASKCVPFALKKRLN